MKTYQAERLPVHRGPAAWNAILPAQPASSPLDSVIRVDVAIVGGGFAGLSAARRLKQNAPDLRIAMLEAGAMAEGASGRNSGFMIDLPHDLQSDDYAGKGVSADRHMIGLNRAAIAFAREAVEDYRIDPAFFDPAGKINGAAGRSGHSLNVSYSDHLDRLGEANEMLDAQAMHEVTGSRHYTSGLFTPGTVMLQPAGYVRSLAAGLRQDSVQIFEGTPVEKIVRAGAGWDLVSRKGRVSAGKVILANNGHLESFGFARKRLMHVFLYASMTVELDKDTLAKLGGQPRWGITPSDPMGTTMRRIDTAQGGNRIITRTCASYLPEMVPSEALVERAARVHREKFADRFPDIPDVPMQYSWAGHLCLSWNGVAVMRELEPNLFSACCDNGLGTVRSTLTGIGAADLLLRKQTEISAHFLAEEEPTKLMPSPFAEIGANLYFRWKEWRARAE
ncbi:NAD(P)/FAD-dependent oxidoreductase [Neorhizobium galegae]|uniref:Oxidoreductase, NAD-binding site n=1 Tax=Neorhizobium galegae bv. orientalis str. HAMBI 540 TaxID=1028800 RepID=A0A068T1L4_NEOGA|nr:FAD-binding oxidoreductase [Neorhizobium galegae]MCQ1854572.1 FAD-binding oxidoreductase [Neorhizobium galegae]CDN51926.1 Oxidoreductase, NAD-binding site [Neorhizobium galegae bv. orientalis str. HAMBI 540]CDZ51572.1 Glycine/D-amino acid oxidase, deaminating [Neorhizobium galegae bv. orientalis]